jgi:4-amino-4-deoxy-L-arabinose transferase-like glycosyltransferase
MAPRYILLAFVLTALTSMSLGLLLLRGLRLRLHRIEHQVLAYLCGAALLSLAVFLLAAAHLVYKGVLLTVAMLSVAACVYTRAWRDGGAPLPPVPRPWLGLLAVVYAVFGYAYFVHAMAPEHSPDGMTYHVTVAARYYREHGFVPWTYNMYANLSHGMEMLFLFGYAFGRHSATAMAHLTLLLTLPLAVLCYARRFGFTVPGVFAAVVVFVSPVVARDGTVAYNDVALAASLFGTFYLLEIWRAERRESLLVCAGLLAGFAFAVKYTGGFAIPWALGTVLLVSRRLRPAMTTAAAAALLVCPWLARNYVYTGNPVAPFFNRWFPNPHFYPDWERNYVLQMRNYGDLKGREVITEPLVVGVRTDGFLGPIFLLAPLGLLALRYPHGRWVVAAGIVFAFPFTQNLGARFLIPAVPFWSLAIGMAFANTRGALAVLAVLHAFISWPTFTRYYCGESAWRLEPKVPVRAALRLIPEEKFLYETEPAYGHARMIEDHVPSNARVFAFGSALAESYTSRDVVVGYNSGFGMKVREALWAPLIPEMHDLRVQEFRFPARMAHRLRIVQTARHAADIWSVTELRVFGGGRELSRDAGWRLRADPNPWDVQRAFDNARLTRWRSHAPLRPGSYVEINFGKAEGVDRVVLESTRDQYEARMSVEVAGESGPWVQVAAAPVEIAGTKIRAVRHTAIDEVKRAGITHLVVEREDFRAEDYHMRADQWGIQEIAERGNARLYRLK